MSRKKITPILPKPRGRRRVPVDMIEVRNLVKRGASNRQVQEILKLSYGTAARRCKLVKDETEKAS